MSQNEVVVGLEIDGELLERLHNEYYAWVEVAKERIHPDEYDAYCKSLERQNLLDNFNMGIEPKTFEYRRLCSDNSWHWFRFVIRIFKDIESDDVFAFGYGFDIANEVRERQALMLSAQTDLFTGLYNKATTENMIGVEIRKGAGILFLFDLDEFKCVNDRFGHEAGDCVLKYFSDLLRDVFRKDDIVGRVGGDEFMAYIKNITDISIAEEKVSKILTRLKIGVDYENIRIIISSRIGITVIDEENYSFSEAYNHADIALYEAKFNEKNSYAIYGKNDERSAR